MSGNRSSLARVYFIHKQLAEGLYPKVPDLAATLEVSTRTVKREIEAMRDRLGLPIEYSYKERGYYYRASVDDFPVFEVNKGELASLFLFKQSLQSIAGTQVAHTLTKIFDELVESLKGTVDVRADDLDSIFSRQNSKLRVGLIERLEELSRAMLDRVNISFEYKSLNADSYEERKIAPLLLREVEHCWYILGFDHSRDAIRTFAVPRMRHLRSLQNETFSIPSSLKSSLAVQQAFGSWIDTDESLPASRITVRLSGYAAQQAMERVWHHSQEVKVLEPALVEVSFNVRDFHELIRWTLSWGKHAKVISPAPFKEAVSKEYKAMQHG